MPSEKGLLTTVAWRIGGETTYALEGLGVRRRRRGAVAARRAAARSQASADVEALMSEVPDTDGVYLVPAFVGLGAPYWDPHARGAIVGLTRNTKMAHIARAAVDAMAYQTRDVLEVMQQEAGLPLHDAEGGRRRRGQRARCCSSRPTCSTCRCAGRWWPRRRRSAPPIWPGLAVGYWDGLDDVRRNWALDREFGAGDGGGGARAAVRRLAAGGGALAGLGGLTDGDGRQVKRTGVNEMMTTRGGAV